MIIGISGKSRSGKDTTARYIDNILTYNYSFPVYIKAFADPLKEMVASIYEIDLDQLYSQKGKAKEIPGYTKIINEKGVVQNISRNDRIIYHDFLKKYVPATYRDALQFYGQKLKEYYGPNYWCNMWKNSIFNNFGNYGSFHSELEYIIIPDVRFPQEIEFLKNLSSSTIFIRINRNNIPLMSDISEWALDGYENWDYVIDNNGTLEELNNKVLNIINDINSAREN